MKPGGQGRKGGRFERMIAAELRDIGFTLAKREGWRQVRAADAPPDVGQFPGIWPELTHGARPAPWDKYAQAVEASKARAPDSLPIVVARKNRRPILACMSWPDFKAFCVAIRAVAEWDRFIAALVAARKTQPKEGTE